jgi:anti-sigma-K factor RskA
VTHLRADQLIDLAEGQEHPAARGHLASCETCQRQLTELRAALGAAREVQVPEPSPLFWDRFSARVRDAVAAESAPRRFGASTWRWWAAAPIAVAAVVVVALYVAAPRPPAAPATPAVVSAGPASAAANAQLLAPFGAADDPSLGFVADLAAQMDTQDVIDSGLVNHQGAIDEAVATLSPSERAELQRILNEELAKS